jgi:hypothetical protein
MLVRLEDLDGARPVFTPPKLGTGVRDFLNELNLWVRRLGPAARAAAGPVGGAAGFGRPTSSLYPNISGPATNSPAAFTRRLKPCPPNSPPSS